MEKDGIGTLGKRLKKSRLAKGYTTTRLGDETGIVHSAISNYEKDIREPSLDIIFKLSKALDVDPMWLKYGFSVFTKKVNKGIYIESYFKNFFELDEAKNSSVSDKTKVDIMQHNINSIIDKLEKKKDYASISAIYQLSNQLLNSRPELDFAKLCLIDKQNKNK